MELAARRRDSDSERLERDAFSLLRHVHSAASGDPEAAVLASRLADSLGLEREYARDVIRYLEREGLVRYDESGPSVSLSVPGVAYVEHLAWRRESVRRRWS